MGTPGSEMLRNQPAARKRDMDTELIRLIASFAVIVAHMLGNVSNSALFINGVCRFAVPVFVMTSGRYVLAHEPDLKKLMKKALRLFIVMLCWSALFYFYYSQTTARPSQSFVAYLLAGPSHLWYIWAIITLYLMSPMMYVFCENASRSTYKYAMCFCFVAGTVITLMLRSEAFTVFSAVLERSKLPNQLGFVFCFMYGNYCRRYGHGLSLAASVVLCICACTATGLSTLVLPENISLSLFSPTAIASAIGLHGIFAYRDYSRFKPAAGVISALAGCTLGIYLIHPMVEELAQMLTGYVIPSGGTVFLCLSSGVSFIICLAVVFVMKKIPLVKELV